MRSQIYHGMFTASHETLIPNAKNSSPINNLKRIRAGWDTSYLERIMMSAGLEKS